MNAPTQVYEQVSARTVSLQVNMAASPQPTQGTQESVAAKFSEVKHLLSGKPLRRPNRTRHTEVE